GAVRGSRVQRVRRDLACARERACTGGGAGLGRETPRSAYFGLPLRSRRQGHADSADHPACGAGVTPAGRHRGSRRQAAAEGEPALVAFLTAGYPSRERFREHLLAVASGADVVEIGIPFTDPMADGVTIQRSSQAALAQGVSLRWILTELEAMRAA